MADSAYEIKETIRELEERATFETRRSALNRITALKLYRLFVEAGEPNPIEYTANAVGVTAASVEKWLGIYQKYGLEDLLGAGLAGETGPRRGATKRRSGSKRRSRRKRGKEVGSEVDVKSSGAESVEGPPSAAANDSSRPDSELEGGATEGDPQARRPLSVPAAPAIGSDAASDAGAADDGADDASGAADNTSRVPVSPTEQDHGASFYSQISRSKAQVSETEPASAAHDPPKSVDQSVVETGEPATSALANEGMGAHRYRESLSRTAKRARLRARVSRRAISRLRRPQPMKGDGIEQEGRESEGSDLVSEPGLQPAESTVVGPDKSTQTPGPEPPSLASLPRRLDRRPKYRPNEKYAASSGHTFANARVLIAEPDDLITDIIRHRLEKQGAEVTSAVDGVEVVSRFWSTTFDLVIVAAALPGLDGFEIARWLRDHQTNSDVPILITSWPGNESDLVRAFDAGADDFLRKPFSPAEMVARSRRLLERVGGWQPDPSRGESSQSGTESSDV